VNNVGVFFWLVCIERHINLEVAILRHTFSWTASSVNPLRRPLHRYRTAEEPRRTLTHPIMAFDAIVLVWHPAPYEEESHTPVRRPYAIFNSRLSEW
jgi:hypothetical protein